MTNSMGAWSPFMTLSQIKDENVRNLVEKVFDNMFGSLIGADNQLVAVRVQVVNGLNVQFLFTSTPVVPNAKTALILTNPIYIPIGADRGDNTGYTVISEDVWGDSDKKGLLGGWSEFHELNAHDIAVFYAALEGHVGVKYVPKEVSSKVVREQGVYRVYKAKGTIIGPKPVTDDYRILILEDGVGRPHLLRIYKEEQK